VGIIRGAGGYLHAAWRACKPAAEVALRALEIVGAVIGLLVLVPFIALTLLLDLLIGGQYDN
jgi:hypothetical protein